MSRGAGRTWPASDGTPGPPRTALPRLRAPKPPPLTVVCPYSRRPRSSGRGERSAVVGGRCKGEDGPVVPGTLCVTRRAKVLGCYGPSLSMDMSEWVEDTMVPHQTMSPPSRNHSGALIQPV